MKHRSFISVSILAIFTALTSCLDNGEAPLYSGSEMCTVINSRQLRSDNGALFNITGTTESSIPDTLKRVFIDCNIMGYTEGTSNEYDIRVIGYSPVMIQDIKKSGENPEGLGDDGIDIETVWIGGGYLNALTIITKVMGSDTAHDINLELDDIRSNTDTLYLTFRHNAHGESFDNPDVSGETIMTAAEYYSFPLKDIIPSSAESIILHLKYDWFSNSGDALLREKETFEGNLTAQGI